MHLKSLTLKGFKSFASATTLRFEPGITAVVGPNGSGKSNVVDAIAWVLGEQGAKALRGGKMEDVIFAGTAGRAPLGRAEVTLTIDNADNALPIEYSEVSITRRMFRDGASEYEINGDTARLLDVQELLSDSGIGREMHVIVGQGQLDSVLQARPEDRRGFIEEAAGVLKHRKRKEKALRKLDGMQANLARLNDLTGELRRQLKPLGRQADIARRAAGIQSELRDSRLRLLADDLVRLRTRLAAEIADETMTRERRSAAEAGMAQAAATEEALEHALAADAPTILSAQETFFALSALQERFRGTQRLAAERLRRVSAPVVDQRPARDPEELEAEAAEVRDAELALRQQLEADNARLASALTERRSGERALADCERALVTAARAVADRREGLARLAGQVSALQSRTSAGGDEIARISASAGQARRRAAEAAAELATAEGEIGELGTGEIDLDARHSEAEHAVRVAADRVNGLLEAARAAQQECSTWAARRDALALGLRRKDGAAAVLAAKQRLPGLIGSIAALVTVEAGYRTAIAAALGPAADGVAVRGGTDAAAAVALLKAEDGGRAALVLSVAQPEVPCANADLPDGARWANDVVTSGAGLDGALSSLLSTTVVVPDIAAGLQLVDAHPGLRAVTRAGDLIGPACVVGGSSSAPSVIEVQAAVDEAAERVGSATRERDQLGHELEQARAVHELAEATMEATLTALHESDARLNAVAERLAVLAQTVRACAAEADRLDQARAAAERSRDTDLAGLVELEDRLRLAEAEPGVQPPPIDERDLLAARVAAARNAEMEARLEMRTNEERVRALSGRADALLDAARSERADRERQRVLRVARARAATIAEAVQQAAQVALERLEVRIGLAAQRREQLQQARAGREAALSEARSAARELSGQLSRLTDAVHRDEVARAEQRLRIEQLEQRAVDEFGVEPAVLVADYGPDQPVPPSSQEWAEYEQARGRGDTVIAPRPGPFDRPMQEKCAARADRELGLLGKVNPLALEEFAALEERHQFLATQLEDLRNTRRDLLTVVKEVDDKILEVFTAAYHDVAREFEVVFASLFPGGEGRLVLTQPDDMLLSGIEVEARPPGKKVKRLSLLSGGERSLTAVAMLVAIFRARPSPFYVLDEIEAALDDVNLGRLVGLIGELRASSQIIVITHQKRTMEVADALYGVTMRGDGISQVISQRLRAPDGVASDRVSAIA